VAAVEELEETPHYKGPCRRISIFLSIFSVHVNRAPFDGTIQDIRRKHGGFLIATKPEASERNESNDVWLETPRGPMTVRQITGVVARRIVCRAKVGDTLAKGEKFGMIKFGSRTELYLPRSAEVCVTASDKVKAGTSVVARFS
jgi:phosphatidylserine decarboxylase